MDLYPLPPRGSPAIARSWKSSACCGACDSPRVPKAVEREQNFDDISDSAKRKEVHLHLPTHLVMPVGVLAAAKCAGKGGRSVGLASWSQLVS